MGDLDRQTTAEAAGAEGSLDDAIPLLYAELRRLARAYLRRERPDHTLQPTALVHEAYLRLAQQHKVDWRNEAQVLGVAAQLMRRVLAAHAERHKAQKRSGTLERIDVDVAEALTAKGNTAFVELDCALNKLSALDERQARVAELRLFGRLAFAQIAGVLSVSVATVERDWASARLWLARELKGDRTR